MASSESSTQEILRRFNEVFLTHQPAGLVELVAEDCVIENLQPAPDGARYIGREACIALWTQIASTPGTFFELEAVRVTGEQGIIRWRYHWGPGPESSVRGVNLMRVREGRIVEALGYVKGS